MSSSAAKSPPECAGVIAITWEQHRRTRELCKWLGIPLHELTYDGPPPSRYARLTSKTLALLAAARPRVVYIQNPSVVLATVVLAARPLLGGYKVVMDAHNEAVSPFTHAYWPITSLARRALRRADITIVTNEPLATKVEAQGGHPLILPDRLPTPPLGEIAAPADTKPFQVMVVATYAADEPIAEIIEAARIVGSDFEFRITGKETKLPEAQRLSLPANVKQTGFLQEEDYWHLMASSHVVLDLTLKPDCLVCGAYEALAARRPMILSANPPTIALFARAAIFVEHHTPAGIVQALQQARASYTHLSESVEHAAREFPHSWERQAQDLQTRIAAWAQAGDAKRNAIQPADLG